METKKKNIPDWVKQLLCFLTAIIASVMLLYQPVFSFQEDKGIIYVRSFTMDPHNLYVIQTNISSGVSDIIDIMPVGGLYICAWAMLITSVLALLCFFDDVWRMRLCVLSAFFAGAYYILMMYYAVDITDEYFTTLYPNLFALLPALVLQSMLVVRKIVAHTLMQQNEDEEKEEDIIEE